MSSIAHARAPLSLAALTLLALLSLVGGARADLLVIAPHPDDDIITAAGVAARARAAGETVWVLYMTNGDLAGFTSGLVREDEAVAAQAVLGVPEDHLIFLGYPDGFLQDLRGPFFASNTARTGSSGLNTTFGDRGLGGMDYHRFVYGASAANNGTNLRNDLAHVLGSYRPNHIFVTSEFDQHPDHASTYLFLIDALAVATSASPSYNPTVHKTIVWNDTSNQAAWPAAPSVTTHFSEPPNLLARTGLVWAQRESLDVPLAAQVMPFLVNMKANAIAAHQTQGGFTGSVNGYISAFLHKDEFFWPAQTQGGNRPPVPNAGSDAQASAGRSVTLNGSASFDPDGTALSYQWRQVAGPTVALSSSAAAQPRFTVPASTTTATAFAFELKVSDGVNTSVADAVRVLVNTTTVPLPSGSNLALVATASASTQSTNQEASKAIDGSPEGFTPANPSNGAHEWASNDQGAGAWIQLSWSAAQTLDRVRLFDRPNSDDNVVSGTLTFSTGASVSVGALPNTGGLTVNFSQRSVTWVRFTVNAVGSNTYNVGLSEFEAYGPSDGAPPPPPVNQAPTAIAGADQSVLGGALVSLSGSGTDPEGTTLSYAWTQTGGASVTLSGSGATRTFTAPAALSVAQTLRFQLTVSDSAGAQASDEVVITVAAASAPPPNQAPSANAGANQTVAGGANVTLTGSGSDPEGAALSYVWTQLSGASVTLVGAGATRSFVSPAATASAQTLVFQLVVSDGSLSSTAAQTTVTVSAAAAPPPPPPPASTNLALSATATASSGANNQTADRARDGFTDGYPSASSHEWASNGQGVGAWLQLTWPSAQTLNQVRLFDRPNTDDRVMGGTLTFSDGASVSVGALDNAGAGLTVPFTSRSVTWVRFTVTQVTATTYNVGLAELQAFNSDAPAPNLAPTANAGANQTVAQGATVTLNGSASSDPEGGTLSYDWAQSAGPGVLTVDDVANPSFIAPSGSASNVTLTFELVVSDGPNTSAPSTTTVTVLGSAAPPPPSTTNFARTASASASTQEASQGAAMTIDGFTDGYPTNETHEWSTQGQGTGAWLQLDWASAQTITQVVLYDRPNADDNVLAGTLTFSNGASVAVGALPNTSGALTVNFSQRSVTWVRFTVNQVSANTYNVGLAEIEVH